MLKDERTAVAFLLKCMSATRFKLSVADSLACVFFFFRPRDCLFPVVLLTCNDFAAGGKFAVGPVSSQLERNRQRWGIVLCRPVITHSAVLAQLLQSLQLCLFL